MNTPPRRATRARTPTAPRHGAAFEEYSPRRSLRLRRDECKSSPAFTNATLSPPPSSPLGPSASPKQARATRKVKKATFVLDEDKKGKGKAKAKAKDGEAETEKGVVAGERADARPTVLNPAAAGLPTPAKTPSRKRNLAPEKVASSAQALFPPTEASSSRSASRAGGLFGVRRAARPPTTPRRKSVMGRIQEEEAEAAIEIFTDSDARRPKVDLDPDNPFLTRPGEETRSSKRIRQKRADKLNNRLSSDALRTDGMVYTFRGKKVFKAFHNLPDREDRAASEDEEEGEDAGLNPAKVKPRLLFQSPARQLELDDELKENNAVDEDVDEEAETEVDEASQSSAIVVVSASSSSKPGSRRPPPPPASRMTPDSEDEIQAKLPSLRSSRAADSTPRRLSGRNALFDEGEDDPFGAPANPATAKAKTGCSSGDEARPRSGRGVKRGPEAALGGASALRPPGAKRSKRALY